MFTVSTEKNRKKGDEFLREIFENTFRESLHVVKRDQRWTNTNTHHVCKAHDNAVGAVFIPAELSSRLSGLEQSTLLLCIQERRDPPCRCGVLSCSHLCMRCSNQPWNFFLVSATWNTFFTERYKGPESVRIYVTSVPWWCAKMKQILSNPMAQVEDMSQTELESAGVFTMI